MEIVLLVALGGLAVWWFFIKKDKKNTPVSEPAPYKVETPPQTTIDTYQPVDKVETTVVIEPPAAAEPAKCGCGRSPTGYCVGLHKLTQEEWAVHPDNPVKPAAPVEVPVLTEVVEEKPKRAKTAKGKFKADDRQTKEVNEAWVGGKAPAKKAKAKTSKAPAKKPARASKK